MGVISSKLRVAAWVPGVMEEIGIEDVQHFVDDCSSAEAFIGKSRHSCGRSPERPAKSYRIGVVVLIAESHITCALSTKIAAKGDSPCLWPS